MGRNDDNPTKTLVHSNGRFRINAEWYISSEKIPQRMLRLRIFTGSPLQVDLWLTEEDREFLKKTLEYS